MGLTRKLRWSAGRPLSVLGHLSAGRHQRGAAVDINAELGQIRHWPAGEQRHGLRGGEQRMALSTASDGIRDP